MRILIIGTGRGGTSITKEVIKGLGIIKFYYGPRQMEEDWNFFKRETLPENYGTKLVTPNPGVNPTLFTIENLIKRMKEYHDLFLIFSFREPIDTCMSKIVRGQKHSDGGDKYWEKISTDGTADGAIFAVRKLHEIYNKIVKLFPERILAVRMEKLILNPKREANRIAKFFGAKITNKSLEFYKYNTNPYQIKRYNGKLDKNQIGLYKKWEICFNGYFKDKKGIINKLKKEFKDLKLPC